LEGEAKRPFKRVQMKRRGLRIVARLELLFLKQKKGRSPNEGFTVTETSINENYPNHVKVPIHKEIEEVNTSKNPTTTFGGDTLLHIPVAPRASTNQKGP
jgi:hypothetical protein